MVIRGWTALVVSIGATAILATTTVAQTDSMQPRKPRTPEQIQQDTADCRAEAKRKTGYDPAQATKQASQPANAPASQADAAYQEAYKSCLTDRGYPLE